MKPLPFPDRRQFLKTGGALAAGLLSHEAQAATNQLPALALQSENAGLHAHAQPRKDRL